MRFIEKKNPKDYSSMEKHNEYKMNKMFKLNFFLKKEKDIKRQLCKPTQIMLGSI